MMKQLKNGDKPINPTPGYDDETGEDKGRWFGLTKREYFAGLAMQGICAGPINSQTIGAELISKAAIAIADELLKQLDTSNQPQKQ